MSAAPPLVEDEPQFLAGLAPLAGARVLDLGCGDASFSRALLLRGLVASVDALEVDAAQHALNLAAPPVDNLAFGLAGAEDIPFPDASFDLVVMLKSLHHVPVDRMDRALAEIARVLRPGGHLYASEPVFAGDFNEVMRLFHDERAVREAALAALDRAAAGGAFEAVARAPFLAPIAFRDFADFERRMMRVTHTQLRLPAGTVERVRERFERHAGPGGVRFDRPMRADLLRRRAA